ncbi:sigma-70 family RNA polymerase sigma factor [Streptomyces sp. NBC_01260]|uniref:RNA polymerase sigma factor n=1 Tax=unclassified Streptomyces TaxID=2593676 RepID=UPI000F4A8E55|nr:MULTISPECIES: sigma-70 family RNA polymerase sigma factor [unclassified Streptomyces]ROQ78406.1 RNA polymerase sigma factor (sigma-70 family) [Streptomyces sp. CEV 2-1]
MTITSEPVCSQPVCRRTEPEPDCRTCPWALSAKPAVDTGVGQGILPHELADFHDVHRVVFLKYARSRGITRDEAEDVVSQTFLHLYRAGQSFLSADNRPAFGFKVLRNVLADHFRATDRRPRALPLTTMNERPATDGGISELICRLDVEKALELLPLQQADCLRLHLFLDLSPTQIGFYLDITRSTVSSHLSAGRQRLAEHLENYRPSWFGRGKEQHA